MLVSFADRWSRDRPTTAGQYAASEDGRTEVSCLGPLQWLSFETGIPEKSIERIKEGRSATTELHVADALVQAMGYTYALYDGTLTIRANPHARREAQAECCPGSAVYA